jgi:hypothetical protein
VSGSAVVLRVWWKENFGRTVTRMVLLVGRLCDDEKSDGDEKICDNENC